MKKASRFAAPLIIVASITACHHAKPFSPPEGNFSVQFPGTPIAKETRTIDTATCTVVLHLFTYESGGWCYIAGYSDYPFFDKGVEGVLDSARDGALHNPKNPRKLLSEERLSLDGHPGRELRMENAQGVLRFRIFIAGTRLYQVGVATPKDAATSPKIEKFLGSLHILPSAKGAYPSVPIDRDTLNKGDYAQGMRCSSFAFRRRQAAAL